MAKKKVEHEIVNRIIKSSSFGSSNTYANLLIYLVDCTLSNEVPKESTIGAQLFGLNPGEQYDTAKVRVYIFNLRKKLEAYFNNEGTSEDFILTIPKGGYKVELVKRKKSGVAIGSIPKSKALILLSALLIISVVINISLWLKSPSKEIPSASLPNSEIWKDFIQDDKPILIILGDLFIFSEQNTETGYSRTIRIPSINSYQQYLAHRDSIEDPGVQLDEMTYTYLIKNSALWIESLTKLFFSNNRDFQIRVMSRVDVKDLHDHNIIFVGMQKTAGILNSYFLNSSFDHPKDDIYTYRSESKEMLSYSPKGEPEEFHTDYGFVAKYAGPNNNTIFMFCGLWDTAASQSLKNFTDPKSVEGLENQMQNEFGEIPDNFEVFFEVSGADRTELDTKVLYLNRLE
ncbi:MAG: helix-turn-helix domain-containing protein [Cyclobacteriaceae bacterium]